MATYYLTDGNGVVGTAGNDKFFASADWSLSGQLAGGGGNDVLFLDYAGIFKIGLPGEVGHLVGISNIILDTPVGSSGLVLDGDTVSITERGNGSHQISPGAGAVTIQGINSPFPNYNSVAVTSPGNWNASNVIDSIDLLSFLQGDYDLTANTLTNIDRINGNGGTLRIDSTTANGVSAFDGFGTLVTANATLDLSQTGVRGLTINSTNALGTTFTVKDLATALQIVGGNGQDKIIAQGFTLTGTQRDAIFHASSIETIVDTSGTYGTPGHSAYDLTNGTDTIVGTSGSDKFYASAATLNAGDQLTGGGGDDVLTLYNSGTFHIDQLAGFTGISNITLDNETGFGTGSSLILGAQTVSVTELGSGSHFIQLGTGAVTIHGIDSPFSSMYNAAACSAANWNASNAIDSIDELDFYSVPDGAECDLTTSTLANIDTVVVSSLTTLRINSTIANAVSAFDGFGSLVTANATLDLSHTTVSGLAINSTNAIGTTFTVKDLATALQIVGGNGQDKIIAQGFTFTASQRDAIFHISSVEKIVDTSGTYGTPGHSAYDLKNGTDTIVGTSGSDRFYTTAATLNAGDQLTGGGGNDVLALYNPGSFHIDQLAQFTGISNITLDNETGFSELVLGAQTVSVTELGSGSHQISLGTGAVTIHGIDSPFGNTVSSSGPNWNASNAIDSIDMLTFGSFAAEHDLTTNTLTNIDEVRDTGATLRINSTIASGVSAFDGYGTLVTANATLDLSHTTVSGLTITSTNAIGTTFTVKDLGTALQVLGGIGQDSIVAQGFAFTAGQRDAIFHTSSVETIVDSVGTYGGAAGDTLVGDDKANRLFGNSGDDLLDGEAGDDVLQGGADNDVLDGGTGVDWADFSDKAAAVKVTLTGAADASVKVRKVVEDTIRNIENVKGGSGDDTLVGDGLANSLFGMAGDDALKGSAGDDILRGGIGKDVLDGGAGTDWADYSDKSAAVKVTLTGAANASVKVGGVVEDTIVHIENVKGGSDGDALVGDGLANSLAGLAGDDLLRGGAGQDVLDGGAGSDWADYSDKTAAVTVTLAGAANAHVKVGGVVEDTIRNIEKLKGGSSGDTLVGDDLSNSMFGLGGNDVMNGKTGNDALTGGLDHDVFVFDTKLNALTNVDRISDFNVADDTIRLENAIFTALGAAGTLSAGAFHIGANATAADDRIIYNQATGELFYDSNGNAAGGMVQFAVLDPGLALTNANFIVS